MKLTPVRCDICGDLCYLEEESIYLLKITGQSSWLKEELEFDICFSCKEKLLKTIQKKQEESEKAND